MEKLIEPKALYRTRQIAIPTPEFYVFYNGDSPYPKEKILKLSDAYLELSGEPMLELIVKVININLLVDHPILRECRPIYEYSWFIQRIKDYIQEGHSRDLAITLAIGAAEQEGILIEFLREHGTEAWNMLFTEFNMEDALEIRGEEKFAEGVSVGRADGLATGRADGEKQFALLADQLIKHQRMPDFLRATKDQSFRNMLYLEYHIK